MTFVCVCSVAKSCLTLWNPIDCSPSGSSVHEIFQARILEWVAISSSRGSSQLRDRIRVSCTGRWILYHCTTWEAQWPKSGALKTGNEDFSRHWNNGGKTSEMFYGKIGMDKNMGLSEPSGTTFQSKGSFAVGMWPWASYLQTEMLISSMVEWEW